MLKNLGKKVFNVESCEQITKLSKEKLVHYFYILLKINQLRLQSYNLSTNPRGHFHSLLYI